LAILRDPVDRAYSHYWMEHVRGRDGRTFAQAVADEIAGRGETDYLERGRYAAQLDGAVRGLPRHQVRGVLLDDLRDRPEATYAEVCRFLGVDDGYRPDQLDARVNRFIAFRSMRGGGLAARRGNRVLPFRSMGVGGLRRRLPKAFRIGRIVGKLNAVEGEYPPVDPEV